MRVGEKEREREEERKEERERKRERQLNRIHNFEPILIHCGSSHYFVIVHGIDDDDDLIMTTN